MCESVSGQQLVGIDLHRRRSVIVRMTTDGDPLECIRLELALGIGGLSQGIDSDARSYSAIAPFPP